ncbi:AraC family transcriptional regulator [Achromobacter denitrificans]|uniref:AraC family transcriptional regulator n=1 Tax=Achromobacter denitrificans TaxID=32002 RepID=UPI0024300F82|nr:AraC family transcriptional regulator [Achromobacter denitrificans]MBV2159267.1 AraC family transcriptional regulator [Achromobacter denitrificans]
MKAPSMRQDLAGKADSNLLEDMMAYLLGTLDLPPDTTPPLPPSVTMSQFEQQFQQAIRLLAAKSVRHGELTTVFDKAGVLLCRVLVTCRTLEEAIRNVMDFYLTVNPRADECGFRRHGDHATFICSRHPAPRHSEASVLVHAIGVLYFIQLFSWLIGAPLRPGRIMLTHTLSPAAEPLLRIFNAPVAVGAGYYGFEFDAELLDRPVIRRAEDIPLFLEGLPCRLFTAMPEASPLHRQIQLYLDAALAHRDPLPRAGAVAAMFSISEATLRRRLRGEGYSYDQLRDQAVKTAALRYLADPSLSVDQISERLGFSDSKSFRRACHRWLGRAPTELRKIHTPQAD